MVAKVTYILFTFFLTEQLFILAFLSVCIEFIGVPVIYVGLEVKILVVWFDGASLYPYIV